MKKLPVFVSLSFLALLVSCASAESSSVSTSSSSSSTSTQESASLPASSSSSSQEEPILSSSEEEEPASSSSVVEEETEDQKYPWNSTLASMMKLHLGGHLIPYFNAGSYPDLSFVYKYSQSNYGYLDFNTTLDYNSTNVQTIGDVFLQEGYVLTGTATYEKASIYQTITIVNSGDYIELRIFYDEPYDSTSVSSYDSDLLTEMNSDFDNHTIPFVYLATAHNYAEPNWSESTGVLSIYGGKWDSKVLTDAQTSLTAANYSVTMGTDTLTATGTDSTGATFTIVISSYSTYTPKVKMQITYRPAFDPTSATDWSSNVKQEMQTDFDNHVLPFIYLGTDDPDMGTYSQSSKTLTLTGSFYNAQVLTLAKTALEADNDAQTTEATKWTIDTTTSDSYGSTVTATKTYEDGCGFQIVIGGSSINADINRCRMVITFYPKLVVPDTRTAWDTSTQTAIDTNIGHDIPYVYLNVEDYTTIGETTAWTNTTRRYLQIRGGYWNRNIIPNAKTAFETAGWTVVESQGTYGTDLTATKTFDGEGENGDTVICDIQTPYNNSSRATLGIRLVEKYEKPTDTANQVWPKGIKTQFTNNFGTSDVPFVYLGTDLYVYSFNSSTNTMTIYGNTYDAQIETDYLAAYCAKTDDSDDTALDWTTTTSTNTYGNVYTSTATDSTGGVWTVGLSFNTYKTPIMTFSYRVPFDPTSFTAWPDDIQTAMTTNWGSTATMPLVYLGTSSPTAGTFTSTSGYWLFTGGFWNDQVITLANTTFTNAGWTTSETRITYGKALIAYKNFSDGSTLTAIVYRNSTSATSAKACMATYYSASKSIDTTLAYTTAQTSTISSVLGGNTLPFFFPKAPTTVSDRTTSTSHYDYDLYIYSSGLSTSAGTALNINWLLAAKTILEADSYTVTIDPYTGTSSPSSTSYYAIRLRASKTLANGYTIRIGYYGSSTYYYCYVTYDAPYAEPDAADQAYSDSISNAISTNFGTTIPYLYLGSRAYYAASYSAVNQTETIYGGTFDDRMFTFAESAFAKDTNHTWTTTYTYVSGKRLVATTTLSTGEYLSVELYKSENLNYNMEQARMTITIHS